MMKRETSRDKNQTEPSQVHREICDAVVAQGPELVKELMKIVQYRGRGGNLATSLEAGKLLLGLLGINTGGDRQTAGSATIINSSGPMQVVGKSETGPDRLTQELIDIVRKGNNGHKPDGKK